MSYDFGIEIDTGGPERHHIEPFFSDAHPAFEGDGMAGNVMVTSSGYSRCGNYTSNVSGIWARCLTAALKADPERAQKYAGHDDVASIMRYGREVTYVDGTKGTREVHTDRLCLRDLAGAKASDIAPILKAAVEWGVEHIDELHEFDPSNGWGDAEGAVTYLWDIQRMCEAHPNGFLYISS